MSASSVVGPRSLIFFFSPFFSCLCVWCLSCSLVSSPAVDAGCLRLVGKGNYRGTKVQRAAELRRKSCFRKKKEVVLCVFRLPPKHSLVLCNCFGCVGLSDKFPCLQKKSLHFIRFCRIVHLKTDKWKITNRIRIVLCGVFFLFFLILIISPPSSVYFVFEQSPLLECLAPIMAGVIKIPRICYLAIINAQIQKKKLAAQVATTLGLKIIPRKLRRHFKEWFTPLAAAGK